MPSSFSAFADGAQLDAASPELYREIRGVDALGIIEAGVERLRALAPETPWLELDEDLEATPG